MTQTGLHRICYQILWLHSKPHRIQIENDVLFFLKSLSFRQRQLPIVQEGSLAPAGCSESGWEFFETFLHQEVPIILWLPH